ncbi:MAG TPA: hypothetical protein ENJ60_05975 [Aeromonadales bacterium]|nr:hypothetical protein [Aeromonadales bacterium]
MTTLKKILFALVILLVLVIVAAYFLPRKVSVERSIEIDAPVAVVYQLVSNLQEFNRWSPWQQRDPDTRYTFTGANGTVGSKMIWQSQKAGVGKGSQEITALKENELVNISLEFSDGARSDSYYHLTALDDNKTRVTWGFSTDLGNNPIARYSGLLFEKWIGPDYEAGLKNLKRVAESEKSKQDYSNLNTEILQFEPLDIIYIEGESSMNPAEMAKVERENFRLLHEYLEQLDASQSGDPLTIMTLWDEQKHRWGYKIALPYSGELKYARDLPPPDAEVEKQSPQNEIKSGKTYAGKVLKIEYFGPYSGLKDFYKQVYAYIKAKKLEITGHSWEVYVGDPETTEEAELETDIYFPIK